MALDPQGTDRVDSDQGSPEQTSMVRKAALASTVGTTIEWYDFFLYNTAAALIFPAAFFPASSTYAGQLESFATYAVGLRRASGRRVISATGATASVARPR